MIETELQNRAPIARCYVCGQPKLEAVCHECGRPMCDAHRHRRFEALDRVFIDQFGHLGLHQLPGGADFEVCHACRRSLWSANTYLRIVSWLLICLVAVLLLWSAAVYMIRQTPPSPGLWTVIVVGTVLAGLLMARVVQTSARPFLPLLPKIDRCTLRELWAATVTVDASGRYQAESTTASGELVVQAHFEKSERDRVDLYRRSIGAAKDENLRFRAGFVAMRGRFNAGLSDLAAESTTVDPAVIRLVDDVARQPFLAGSDAGDAQKWQVRHTYHVKAPPAVPVVLLPSLAPETQRTLRFELQWQETPTLADMEIEYLNLSLPVSWGNIENASDLFLVVRDQGTTAVDTTVLPFVWKKPPLDEPQRAARCRLFWVQFTKDLELKGNLAAELKVTFRGSLSLVEGFDVYHPLGRRRADASATARTELTVSLNLDLRSMQPTRELRYALPDESGHDGRHRIGEFFPGVPPDHKTISALTGALADLGIYVKQVFDYPPRAIDPSGIVVRSWAISGRFYLGLFPIDFRLIVDGEEHPVSGLAPPEGNSWVLLTVRGLVNRPPLEREIDHFWARLQRVTRDTLISCRVSQKTTPSDR